MKVLILTGKFGMGHWSASQSLAQQFQDEEPGTEVKVLDFIDYAVPSASEAWYKGFSLLVTHGSGIYNTYYKMTENMESDAHPPFEWHFLDRLSTLLGEEEPDMVVATHPLCAQLVSRYKQETGAALPLVTCITDLSVHGEWINSGTDCYLVGTPELRERLARKGVDPAIIVATGIPVKAQFKTTPHRRDGQRRHLLIMGGGLGLLPRKDRFYEELNALPGVETTIIAGRNEKLRERLDGKYEHIHVVGYTDRVYDYMAQADLMLSKPGGITMFESIFFRTAPAGLGALPPAGDQQRPVPAPRRHRRRGGQGDRGLPGGHPRSDLRPGEALGHGGQYAPPEGPAGGKQPGRHSGDPACDEGSVCVMKKRKSAGRFAALTALAALLVLAGRLAWGWRQVHAHE